MKCYSITSTAECQQVRTLTFIQQFWLKKKKWRRTYLYSITTIISHLTNEESILMFTYSHSHSTHFVYYASLLQYLFVLYQLQQIHIATISMKCKKWHATVSYVKTHFKIMVTLLFFLQFVCNVYSCEDKLIYFLIPVLDTRAFRSELGSVFRFFSKHLQKYTFSYWKMLLFTKKIMYMFLFLVGCFFFFFFLSGGGGGGV